MAADFLSYIITNTAQAKHAGSAADIPRRRQRPHVTTRHDKAYFRIAFIILSALQRAEIRRHSALRRLSRLRQDIARLFRFLRDVYADGLHA